MTHCSKKTHCLTGWNYPWMSLVCLIRNLKHVKGPGYHSFKSVVNRKNTWTAKPTCQLLSLDQSTSWQCQKPRLYMFILLTRWFPPSYVVGLFWPHELFWCVYHKASQNLVWLLVNKRTVASIMRCHEVSWDVMRCHESIVHSNCCWLNANLLWLTDRLGLQFEVRPGFPTGH